MRLLFCCLAFASVAVPFGRAQDLDEVYEILRLATNYEIDWTDVQLPPEKFVEVYTKLFPQGNAERFSEHVFRTFDSDNSGLIEFREFLMVTYISLDAMPEQKLDWAFQLYDVNGDGTVERSETTEIIEAIYEMWGPSRTIQDPSDTPERRTREFFANVDENSDGVLSKDEFFSGCLDDEFICQMLTADISEWSEIGIV